MKTFEIIITTILILIWKCGSYHSMVEAIQYSFSVQPTDYDVQNGWTGYLKCVIANNVDASACYWLKNNIPVNIVDRYQYTGTPSTGDCSISITNSNLNVDDAEWVCGMPESSSGIDDPLRSNPPAKYTVLYAPKPPMIKQDGKQVTNGTELIIPNYSYPPKIECKSETGNPAADLRFILENTYRVLNGNYTVFNETMMNNKTQTAILQLTAPIDMSWANEILSCEATHPAYNTTAVFAKLYLRIPYTPTKVELKSDVGNDVIKADSHQQITLYCSADGYPVPVLSWFNRHSDNDEWVSFREYSTGNGTVNTTLEATSSQYMCKATTDGQNSFLSNIITIELEPVASSAQIGIIIAIAVGSVVLIALVAIGICLCCRRNKKIAKKTTTRQSTSDRESDPNKRHKTNFPLYKQVSQNRNTQDSQEGFSSDA